MNKELKDKLVTLIAVATSDERYYWRRLMDDESTQSDSRYVEAKAYLKGIHAVLDTLSELTPEPKYNSEFDTKLKSKLDELNIDIDFSK